MSSWTPGPHSIVLHLMHTRETWSLCFVIHMERSMGHLQRKACRYSAILMPKNPEVVDVRLLLWDYCLDRNAIRAVWVNNVTCTRPWQECLQFMPFPAGNGWKLELAHRSWPNRWRKNGQFCTVLITIDTRGIQETQILCFYALFKLILELWSL